MSGQVEEIELQLTDPPSCFLCCGGTLLLAGFSHSWTNARDEEVTGVREAVLCPACDRGESADGDGADLED